MIVFVFLLPSNNSTKMLDKLNKILSEEMNINERVYIITSIRWKMIKNKNFNCFYYFRLLGRSLLRFVDRKHSISIKSPCSYLFIYFYMLFMSLHSVMLNLSDMKLYISGTVYIWDFLLCPLYYIVKIIKNG